MILVIGCGFVGEAVATNLESNGQNYIVEQESKEDNI